MFQKIFNHLSRFVYNEHFIHSLRITIAIILPTFLGFYLGFPSQAIYIGLGTLLIGLSDVPSDMFKKNLLMLFSSFILAAVALITALSFANELLLLMLILFFCFSFTMLGIYGGTISAIGSMALMMMVLTIGFKPPNALEFSACIFIGGIWNFIISAFVRRLVPYQQIKLALSSCTIEISAFLRKKALFYDVNVPLDVCFKNIIADHNKVSEKQEKMRSILLHEKAFINSKLKNVNRHIQIAAEVIDLYEEVLAIHDDYQNLRLLLTDMRLLQPINQLINLMADDLEVIGRLIIKNRSEDYSISDTALRLEQLKTVSDNSFGQNGKLLKKIVDNLDRISTKITTIGLLMNAPFVERISKKDAFLFSANQSITFRQMYEHLNYRSPVFRFALRLTFCCLFAHIISLFFLSAKYDYWLVLTVLVVSRPGFNNTKRRNFQRVKGTLFGIAVAFAILLITPDTNVQVIFIILFLWAYIGFLHIDYQISVFFITLVAILGIEILGNSQHDILWQRGLDTIIGCAASLLSTLLFPLWEKQKIKNLLTNILVADIAYLDQLLTLMSGEKLNVINYKLARKQVFISSANFSSAYELMLAEPNSEKETEGIFIQVQILNHQLYAYVASLFHEMVRNSPATNVEPYRILIKKAVKYLSDSVNLLNIETSLDAASIQRIENDTSANYSDGNVPSAQSMQIVALARRMFMELNKLPVNNSFKKSKKH